MTADEINISREKIYYNAFNALGQFGAVRFSKLLNNFTTLEQAWQAPAVKLSQAGLEESIVQKLLASRRELDPEAEFEKLEKRKIAVLIMQDPAYPKLLKEISNPPMVLYVRGELPATDEAAVAVVGSRKFTAYGQRVVSDLVSGLVRAGLVIVSGLALGIDALAHRAAVESGGRTFAVLACGLDSVYPANNRVVAEKILEKNGALLSELPLGTPPLKHHFPHRNRIISGLALGTIVVEAAIESGALITARHALEQNRQVYAVPGSIYNPASEGPNNLIKMGAKPATTAADILEDLNLPDTRTEQFVSEVKGDNEEEQKILSSLSREPLHFDKLIKLLGLPAATLAATLTILEMKGKIKNLGGNQYVKIR